MREPARVTSAPNASLRVNEDTRPVAAPDEVAAEDVVSTTVVDGAPCVEISNMERELDEVTVPISTISHLPREK